MLDILKEETFFVGGELKTASEDACYDFPHESWVVTDAERHTWQEEEVDKEDEVARRIRLAVRGAKEKGAVLVIHADIPDTDHLDCVWYGGPLFSLHYKGMTVNGDVQGEVRINGTLDGEEYSYIDKNNDGGLAPRSALKQKFCSDRDLASAIDEGDITYDNNSWIELFLCIPGVYPMDGFVCDNYDVLAQIESYDECIELIEEELKRSEEKVFKRGDRVSIDGYADELGIEDYGTVRVLSLGTVEYVSESEDFAIVTVDMLDHDAKATVSLKKEALKPA